MDETPNRFFALRLPLPNESSRAQNPTVALGNPRTPPPRAAPTPFLRRRCQRTRLSRDGLWRPLAETAELPPPPFSLALKEVQAAKGQQEVRVTFKTSAAFKRLILLLEGKIEAVGTGEEAEEVFVRCARSDREGRGSISLGEPRRRKAFVEDVKKLARESSGALGFDKVRVFKGAERGEGFIPLLELGDASGWWAVVAEVSLERDV